MFENFYHDDQTARQVFDARNSPSVTIDVADIFYIGYQVSIGNAMWYHHTVLLADSIETLLNGSVALAAQIRDNLGFNAQIIPVFARSLMAEDDDVIDSAYRSDITQEIDAHLAIKQAGSFIVFGIVGENKITLMKVPDDNAMSAILSACISTKEQIGEEFFPVDVCQAHRVTREFSVRFDAAACRIKSVLSAQQASVAH